MAFRRCVGKMGQQFSISSSKFFVRPLFTFQVLDNVYFSFKKENKKERKNKYQSDSIRGPMH
jgi:hypothetical protein